MSFLLTHLTGCFDLLVHATLQASILILLILGLRRVLGRRLPARWLYILWLVLLVRLALPWTPASRLSVYGLLPKLNPPVTVSSLVAPPAPLPMLAPTPAPPVGSPSAPTQRQARAVSAPAASPSVWSIRQPLYLAWLAGILGLGAVLLAANIRFLRAIRREPPIVDEQVLRLLEECKARMGVKVATGLVASDQVQSPALYGFMRPRLLLPRGLIHLSHAELRHVFLHELAHLKRRDVPVGCLMGLLQVLHWPNPLVWLAMRDMRLDRELACDALALAAMAPDTPQDYGRTILHVFECFPRRQRLPARAGIMDSPSQLQRRIAMLARPIRATRTAALLGLGVFIALAGVTLTDTQRATADGGGEKTKAPTQRDAAQPASQNAPLSATTAPVQGNASLPHSTSAGRAVDNAAQGVAGAASLGALVIEVVDGAGNPVPNAIVTLWNHGHDLSYTDIGMTRRLKTNAHGELQVTRPADKSLQSTPCIAEVDAPGCDWSFANISPGEHGRRRVVVRKSGPCWRGRVVDAQGKPRAGAAVYVIAVNPTPAPDPFVDFGGVNESVQDPFKWKVLTDQNGRFALRRFTNKYWTTITVMAPGCATLQTYFDPDEGGNERVFTLVTAAQLHARLVFDGARPADISGFWVCVMDTDDKGDQAAAATARPDATVAFDDMTPGTYDVVVRTQDKGLKKFVCTTPVRVELAAGRTAQVDLHIAVGVRVTGKLLLADGKPPSKRSGVAAYNAAKPRLDWPNAEVAADGSWELYLPGAGEYQLFYRIEGMDRPSPGMGMTIKVEKGKPVEPITITAAATPAASNRPSDAPKQTK